VPVAVGRVGVLVGVAVGVLVGSDVGVRDGVCEGVDVGALVAVAALRTPAVAEAKPVGWPVAVAVTVGPFRGR
jgi:hypothetical protein